MMGCYKSKTDLLSWLLLINKRNSEPNRRVETSGIRGDGPRKFEVGTEVHAYIPANIS